MKFKETKIIKNFDYPVSCIDLNLSESGNFLASIGTYKPSVKVHDLVNIAQKSNRHLEAEPLKVLSLTINCEKLALLRVDRYVEFHVKYGMHEKIRMPKMCYDMKINKFQGDLLACGKSSEIFRFNLVEGNFEDFYKTSLDCIMSLDINNVHGLLGYCGSNKMEFIDQRALKVVSTVDCPDDLLQFTFSENGINFATGSNEGNVDFYDLRSKGSIFNYKHKNSIRKIKMIGKSIVSIDKDEVCITSNNELYDKISLDKPINTFDIDGGVIFLGLDDSNMRTYYSTDFGPIPDWCHIIKVNDEI